jgi:hypothetical protein
MCAGHFLEKKAWPSGLFSCRSNGKVNDGTLWGDEQTVIRYENEMAAVVTKLMI